MLLSAQAFGRAMRRKVCTLFLLSAAISAMVIAPAAAAQAHAVVPPASSSNNQPEQKGENADECSPSRSRDRLPASLQAGAVIGLFAASFVGAALPSLAKRVPPSSSGGPSRLEAALRVSAFAGSGVMLSTAFLHLLLPAQEALRSPCLPSAWLEGYPDAALLITASTVALAMVAEFLFVETAAARKGGLLSTSRSRRRGRGEDEGEKNAGPLETAKDVRGARSAAVDVDDAGDVVLGTGVAGFGEQRDGDDDGGTAAVAETGAHFARCCEERGDVEHALSGPRVVSRAAAAAPAEGSSLVGGVEAAPDAAAGSLLLQLPEETDEAEETAKAEETAQEASGNRRDRNSNKRPLVPGLSAREHEKGMASCCRKGKCARGMRRRVLELLFGSSPSHLSSSASSSPSLGEGERGGGGTFSLPTTTAAAAAKTPSSSPRILELAAAECSICAHSIIIGVALGTTPERSAFVPLLVALLFHQLLEGVALGSAAAAAGVRPRSTAALALAALFAITTPLGTAIGLGIRSSVSSSPAVGAGAGSGEGATPPPSLDPSTSRASLLAMGVADAVAAGLLLHLSSGSHCANALWSSAPWLRSKGPAMHAACVGAFLAGVAMMAYIAVWA